MEVMALFAVTSFLDGVEEGDQDDGPDHGPSTAITAISVSSCL